LIYSQTTSNNETSEDALEVFDKEIKDIFSDKPKTESNASQLIINRENVKVEEYENSDLGIKIKYPSSEWAIDFNNNAITLFPDNYFDKNNYLISITKIDLGKLTNMENTMESLIIEFVNQYVNSDRYVIPGISDNPNVNDKLLKVNLSNNSIKGYEFFLLDKLDPLSNTVTATTINNTLYTIEYKHPSSLFDPTPRQKYLPVYEQILNSIQFTSDDQKQKSIDGLNGTTTSSNQTHLSKNSTQDSDISPKTKLEILSHSSFIDSIENMHVIGEVENNTPKVIEYVKIIGTFYDNNNRVVGTSSTYTDPPNLGPGEISPFDLILGGASVSINQIERYILKVTGE
jgi:hypothetical protein